MTSSKLKSMGKRNFLFYKTKNCCRKFLVSHSVYYSQLFICSYSFQLGEKNKGRLFFNFDDKQIKQKIPTFTTYRLVQKYIKKLNIKYSHTNLKLHT